VVQLVERAEEIVVELAPLAAALGDRLRARLESATSASDPAWTAPSAPNRDAEYVKLLAALGHEPQSLDTLCGRTAIPVASLSSMLLVLELEGEVSAARGGMYSRSVGA